ncbi:hypothetical protein F2Q69_00005323 [Brassica cretica]|uniref:Uncharacterized protein n=1 Tax=Brassica cretica TaxID=69181 RepID=A0A8S9PMK9_BRACR|nr:hypothetical protein F2Q69_00005323 [Brassica cretica]
MMSLLPLVQYEGVHKVETVTVVELNAYVLNSGPPCYNYNDVGVLMFHVHFSVSDGSDSAGFGLVRLPIARPATCDMRPATDRRLLFFLMSRNMRPAIGRMSQVEDCCSF